jgi:sugar O-acyltransferase (sialic acid O-acetyltransferase NeuD family)
MKKLLIFGIGGQGKVVLDCALAQGGYTEIAFMANDKQKNEIAGYPLYQEQEYLTWQNDGTVDLSFLRNYDEVIVAEGNNEVRLHKAKLFLDYGIKLATIIHPSAVVSKFAEIQAGTVVFANAVVNPFAKIGIACIINTGAIIEHECHLSDGVHISPGAGIAGTVSIGEKCWVGIGSTIINNLSIGANSIVGAGSVVLEDVPANVLAAGVPAKIKKSVI